MRRIKIDVNEEEILQKQKTCYDQFLTTYNEEKEDRDYYNINSVEYLKEEKLNILVLLKSSEKDTYFVECFNRDYLIKILSDSTKGVYACFIRDDIPDSPNYLEDLIDDSKLYYRIDLSFGSFYLEEKDVKYMTFTNKKLFYLQPKLGENRRDLTLERTVSRRVFLNHLRDSDDEPVEENYFMSGNHCQKGSEVKVYTIAVCEGEHCLKDLFDDREERKRLVKKVEEIDDDILDGRYVIYDNDANLTQELWYKEGFLDRDENEGPAEIIYDKRGKKLTERYRKNGLLHRRTGPARIEYNINEEVYAEYYHQDGENFRDDDLPNYIQYYDDKILEKESWLKRDGIEGREGELPSSISYDVNGRLMSKKYKGLEGDKYYLELFYPNGKLKTIEWYQDDEPGREGALPAVIEYFESGKVKEERWYRNGYFSHKKMYNEDGSEYVESESEDWSDY